MKDAAQRPLFFNNSVILPEQNNIYDAVYRLIKTNGREQIGVATFGSTDNFNDASWMGGSQPGNDINCQNYTQFYKYDEVGNILLSKHVADQGRYSRIYVYEDSSNKLINSTVGSSTYNYEYDTRGNTVSMPHLSNMSFNYENCFSIAGLGGGGNAYYQFSGGKRTRKTIINGAIEEERIYLGNLELYRKYISGVLEIERISLHIDDFVNRIAMIDILTTGNDDYNPYLEIYIYIYIY